LKFCWKEYFKKESQENEAYEVDPFEFFIQLVAELLELPRPTNKGFFDKTGTKKKYFT